MKRVRIVSLVLLGLIALLLVVLAVRNPAPPFLPADADHAAAGDTPACLACHGVDAPMPRSTNHPLGEDCWRCHARR
ncbi:MAG TPA: hypothetical protein VD788_12020 [Candidatus Polarisedimenticolaceae bacterium]|nr:hypothetical protein [Candidatus Polarisedimenticolaceae bacterium]